jgi:hypothetical protein
VKATDVDETKLEAETKTSSWFLLFHLVHQIHHFLRVYAGHWQQEEPSTPVEDARLEAHAADKSKPGCMPVHYKEGNVEVPW